MKTNEIKLGAVYRIRDLLGRESDVQVTGRLIRGWKCQNVSTGREMKIRDAKQFRQLISFVDMLDRVPDYKQRAAGDRDE